MAQKIINNGTFDNDPSAEKIRTAFDKVNENFTEVYAMGGGGGAVDSVDGLTGSLTTGAIVNSLTEKVTIVDNDLIGGSDSEASNASKKWKLSTIATYVLSKLGATLWALTAKTTPVDADTITINDTADSNVLKKVTLTNLWANYIKIKADTIYQALLVSGTNIKTVNGNSLLGSGDLVLEDSYVTRRNSVIYAMPFSTTFQSIGLIGGANSFTITGTIGSVSINFATKIGVIPFIKATSTAGAGNSCGWREVSIFNTSLVQGFDYLFLFGVADALNNTARNYVGLVFSAASIGNIDPTNITVFNIGIGSDSGDDNLSIMHKDLTGVHTKTTLGANFPAHDSTKAYSLRLICQPSLPDTTYTITWEVKELVSGNTSTGSFTSSHPLVSDTRLAHHVHRNTGTNTGSAVIQLSMIKQTLLFN